MSGWIIAAAAAAAVSFAGMVAHQRAHPSPLPYSQRFMVQGPHPFLGRRRLLDVLEPSPGERILEVGPGTGYHALVVAERLAPGGTLETVDVIREYLDHTAREAAGRGITNVSTSLGDAASLPFENESMDAAFCIQVLGEVPDQDAALCELRRVVRPGGRIVIGESLLDPHFVRGAALRARARRAGLELERRVGGPLAYLARLRRI